MVASELGDPIPFIPRLFKAGTDWRSVQQANQGRLSTLSVIHAAVFRFELDFNRDMLKMMLVKQG
ncbi:MAG: hypothetical protein KDH97_25430, partial [Calditrichaeota bacterium]|nr:hypothetical protein [Calditrichota bacterium]